MDCARTRGVEISTYELFYLQGHSSPHDAAELREKDGEQASTQLRNHIPAQHTSTQLRNHIPAQHTSTQLRNHTPAQHTSTIALLL